MGARRRVLGYSWRRAGYGVLHAATTVVVAVMLYVRRLCAKSSGSGLKANFQDSTILACHRTIIMTAPTTKKNVSPTNVYKIVEANPCLREQRHSTSKFPAILHLYRELTGETKNAKDKNLTTQDNRENTHGKTGSNIRSDANPEHHVPWHHGMAPTWSATEKPYP